MQGEFEIRVAEQVESLDRLDFVMKNHTEFAERLLPVRIGGVLRIGLGEIGNDRVQVGVVNFITVENLDDRFAGKTMSRRINGVVVDERVAVVGGAGGRHAQL